MWKTWCARRASTWASPSPFASRATCRLFRRRCLSAFSMPGAKVAGTSVRCRSLRRTAAAPAWRSPRSTIQTRPRRRRGFSFWSSPIPAHRWRWMWRTTSANTRGFHRNPRAINSSAKTSGSPISHWAPTLASTFPMICWPHCGRTSMRYSTWAAVGRPLFCPPHPAQPRKSSPRRPRRQEVSGGRRQAPSARPWVRARSSRSPLLPGSLSMHTARTRPSAPLASAPPWRIFPISGEACRPRRLPVTRRGPRTSSRPPCCAPAMPIA